MYCDICIQQIEPLTNYLILNLKGYRKFLWWKKKTLKRIKLCEDCFNHNVCIYCKLLTYSNPCKDCKN